MRARASLGNRSSRKQAYVLEAELSRAAKLTVELFLYLEWMSSVVVRRFRGRSIAPARRAVLGRQSGDCLLEQAA